MAHALVIGLFSDRQAAAAAARALHQSGVDRDHLSVVARTQNEEEALATEFDASPGADMHDSRLAARLGELGGLVVAAVASVMPGIGPIVSAGPITADLGAVAGHVAGGLSTALIHAGIDDREARRVETAVKQGSVLLGVHADDANAAVIRPVLEQHGATLVVVTGWESGD
jgi:hypothetical protein